ncbi:MAG: hypothetical protein AB7Q45_22505, partial [Planctomycetaceae bacterium]
MTQLVGRVLRQPYQERTPFSDLNESYVYCLRETSTEVSREVKAALEREGYEGGAQSQIVDATKPEAGAKRTVRIRQQFLDLYRRQFEGKIYLPHFCVANGNGYEPLDYFRHLVSQVDVSSFPFPEVAWSSLRDEIDQAKERFYRVTLGQPIERVRETDVDHWEPDAAVKGWIAASLPFDYLSHKQLRRIVDGAYARLCERELYLEGNLALVKFEVRNRLERFIQQQLNRQTEAAFRQLHSEGRLKFYLKCEKCRFEIPPENNIRTMRPLTRTDGSPVARSLFDDVEHESVNEYERAVALCMDRDEKVLWWYRNLVGSEHFHIQGYRRERIRPDFVVHGGTVEAPLHRVLVVESKGAHLEGNLDTRYKENVAAVFNDVGSEIPWQQLADDFSDQTFRFQVLDEIQDFGRD